MRLSLYQPDIPQNLGSILRLCACLGVPLDIIEPCGFPLDAAKIRRSAMDYADAAEWRRHASWEAFLQNRPPGRLILLSTKAATPYHRFAFAPSDTLLMGRESAGVPEEVHQAADARVLIPLASGMRSLNVAQAAAVALAEALRQTGQLPGD